MGERLDALIDNYLKSKDEDVFSENTSVEDKKMYISAVKQKIADEIRNEMKTEVAEEAIKDAQIEIEENSLKAKLKEYRRLTVDGLLIAFCVGMLVNQSTEIIGYFKGTIQLGNPWITFMLCIVFFAIVVGIFLGLFFSEIIKVLGKNNNESD